MERQETPFDSFIFNEEELRLARTLSPLQRCYIQTLLADASAEKLAEEFDPEHPLISARKEAYLRGQMDILNMLLAENGGRPQRYSPINPPKQAND